MTQPTSNSYQSRLDVEMTENETNPLARQPIVSFSALGDSRR
jgi:hypothetical protein